MAKPKWMEKLIENLGTDYYKIPAFKKWVNFASVDLQGYPRTRTIVFRGFIQENSPQAKLRFTTDYRSNKILELQNNPFVEICWFFSDSMQQFRIHGKVEILPIHPTTSEEQISRSNLWKELNPQITNSFSGPPPGTPQGSKETVANYISSELNENFCILLLIPKQVDWLNLKSDPAERILFKSISEDLSLWSEISVIP